MNDLTRRRLLEFGTAATALSVAGCLDEPAPESATNWFPASNESLLTAHLNLDLTRDTSGVDPIIPMFLPSRESGDSTEFVPRLPSTDEIPDPLLRFPLEAGGQAIGVGVLGLAATGLGYLVDPEEPTRGVTDLYVVNDTVVGTGDIDTERAGEALRSGTDGILGGMKLTQSGEHEEYALYEANTDEGGIVALSEKAIVTAETSASVRTAIDAQVGETDRIVETDETAAWLFETAGLGDLSVGLIGPVDLEEYYWGDQSPSPAAALLGEREHALSTISLAPEDDEITAELAVGDPDLTENVTEEIESQFGTAASDASVSAETDRLSASGTYTGNTLDIEFVERKQTETPTAPAGEDVPEAVAAAVEEVGFTFEQRSDANLVQVNVNGNLDADEVTLRARPSGGEVSTESPSTVNYLSVPVASDDEEVVVIVTVDDESGIVARTTLDDG